MKVLIAEDHAVTRRDLEVTLPKWGYEVVVCRDGSQAWDRLNGEQPPELAVLDWMMPGIDGLELCRRVRQSPDPTSTYIILLTVRGHRDDIIEALDAGADDYISKPFDREELRARVRVGQRVVKLQRQRLKQETARYVEQLERAVVELRRSRSRIVTAQEEARKAIAEKLHGAVQTQIYLLCMKLDEIGDMVSTSPQEAQRQLAQAVADLDSLRENQIRGVSHQLHPAIIGVGLAAGIRSLRDQYERVVPTKLEIAQGIVEREPAGSSTIPFNVRLCLYRVADEALSNVVKHADARHVRVSLGLDDQARLLTLTVEDDGSGFEPDDSRRGLGRVTMEDYLGALGGSLQLETAPGVGTRITANVPLDTESDRSLDQGGQNKEPALPPAVNRVASPLGS